MDTTRQDSGSNAHRAAGTPNIQQTSQGTQTGTFTTQVAIAAQFDSFLLFRDLPDELKAKILNIAAREVPRTIEMTPQETRRGYTPALLRVSHMAREEALKVYNTALRPGFPQPIYFNPDNDTLLFDAAVRRSTFRTAPPLLIPIASAPGALTPIALTPPALTPPALTPLALAPPATTLFSSTGSALRRPTFVIMLDLNDMSSIPEWMVSLGIKSFVVRLGY
ncbi:hypothetical protein BTUL_0298g00010 [Botrytis tulipae]|uniref:2EXR domain-containing protein n=1 Tax=Botrytis tulipae TaxID=87230 RepID=A0A4Z1E7B7_9HELO|nr:hypothetical protein BTUL_0298g00010 [Botrytis tulipae]